MENDVLKWYNAGIERNRLRVGVGRIEWERTREILLERLPKPPAVIYDIGGGYGEYAWWLASLGYEVHLLDLSATNIAMSEELAEEYPGVALRAAEVCDACDVPRPDGSAEVVLLMGPLYSILSRRKRIRAIREGYRLLKKGGVLFSAALTPFSVLIPRITMYRREDTVKCRELEDPAVVEMIERALKTGEYRNPEHTIARGLGTSHLHTAKELREELCEGGFATEGIYGVMGGAWLAPELDVLWQDTTAREVLMKTVRILDGQEEILGLSGHLLAVSYKK